MDRKKVQDLLEEQGKWQYELAAFCFPGKKKPYQTHRMSVVLSSATNGRTASLDMCKKVAKFLGVTVNDIISG